MAMAPGLNAGWLGAASGIGVSLALQHWPRGNRMGLKSSAALLGAVCCYGAVVTSSLGPSASVGSVGSRVATWSVLGDSLDKGVAKVEFLHVFAWRSRSFCMFLLW